MSYLLTIANLTFLVPMITVRRRKNEELHSKNLVGTVKRGDGGVLVWGCMSALRLGNLVFIDDIMNHSLYLNILRDN